MTPDELRSRLDPQLSAEATAWLDQALHAVAADPTAAQGIFPAVSRHVGRGPLHPDVDPDDPFAMTTDDAARALLIHTIPRGDRSAQVQDLYQHGDTREKRGVLRSLDLVEQDQAMATLTAQLVDDALRTNDIRLVAAALGPAGVAALSDEAFAQAVLKCVFTGIDIDRIPGLHDRVTPPLSRMMADFVHERIAAGRDVPAQVWPVIDTHPPQDRLAAIMAEGNHTDPNRAAAAHRALAKRR